MVDYNTILNNLNEMSDKVLLLKSIADKKINAEIDPELTNPVVSYMADQGEGHDAAETAEYFGLHRLAAEICLKIGDPMHAAKTAFRNGLTDFAYDICRDEGLWRLGYELACARKDSERMLMFKAKLDCSPSDIERIIDSGKFEQAVEILRQKGDFAAISMLYASSGDTDKSNAYKVLADVSRKG